VEPQVFDILAFRRPPRPGRDEGRTDRALLDRTLITEGALNTRLMAARRAVFEGVGLAPHRECPQRTFPKFFQLFAPD
jgi:hypothetical protein